MTRGVLLLLLLLQTYPDKSTLPVGPGPAFYRPETGRWVLLPRGCKIFGDLMQDGNTVVCNAPVDPVDVPAIQRELATQIVMEGIMVAPPCEGRWAQEKNKAQVCYEKRWTCRNPADVLLTSEDGHHWCHEIRPLLPANGKAVKNK